jgi:hypothetical protein
MLRIPERTNEIIFAISYFHQGMVRIRLPNGAHFSFSVGR